MVTLRYVTTVVVVVVFAVRHGDGMGSAALQGQNDSSTETRNRAPSPSPRRHAYSTNRLRYNNRHRAGGRDISQTHQILYSSIVPLVAVLGILIVLILACKQRSLLVRVHSIVHRLEQGSHIYSSLTGAREPANPGSYTQVHYAAGGDNAGVTHKSPHAYSNVSLFTHVDAPLRLT